MSEAETFKERLKNLRPPEQYTPAITTHSSGEGILPAMSNQWVRETYADVLKNVVAQQHHIASQLRNTEALISKIRSHVSSYVLNIFYKYKFAGIIDSVFEQCRREIESKLISICPDAVKELVAVYERLPSDKREEWAQAMASCRRFLKDVADIVYPASSESYQNRSGKTLEVTDGKYKNRILAFIDQTFQKSNRKDFLRARLDDLGNRIDAIYNFISQGVHTDDLNKNDINMCAIDTFLVVGALIQTVEFQEKAKNR